MAPRLATVRSLTMRSADCVQLMNKTKMNADDAIGTCAEREKAPPFRATLSINVRVDYWPKSG